MSAPIKWDCVKTSSFYWIRAEKTEGDTRRVVSRLIYLPEWQYSNCQRYMLESIIYGMTMNLEAAK